MKRNSFRKFVFLIITILNTQFTISTTINEINIENELINKFNNIKLCEIVDCSLTANAQNCSISQLSNNNKTLCTYQIENNNSVSVITYKVYVSISSNKNKIERYSISNINFKYKDIRATKYGHLNYESSGKVYLLNSIVPYVCSNQIDSFTFESTTINSSVGQFNINNNRNMFVKNGNLDSYCSNQNIRVVKKRRSIDTDSDIYLLNTTNVKFNNKFYHFKILEKQPADTFVGQIEIIFNNEGDKESIKLYLKTSDQRSQSIFYIDSKSGSIYSKKMLISSFMDSYFYTVVAVNTSNNYIVNTVPLLIKCLDINDHAPMFVVNPYMVNVVEKNAENALLIRVRAIDDDFGDNALISYKLNTSLLANDEQSLFQINEYTGEIIVTAGVLNKAKKQFYSLNVIATDHGVPALSGSTIVNVKVVENGVGLLSFEQQEYNITLKTNDDYIKNPIIFKVRAFDSGKNGVFTYSLEGSVLDLKTFEIDPKTGYIKLISILDYDTKREYLLTVVVSDEKSNVAYALLNIIVDANSTDTPMFTSNEYDFIAYQNTPIGGEIGKIDAFDHNSLIGSAEIKYNIISTLKEQNLPIGIGQTNGTLFLNNNINTDNQYEFLVSASDSLNPNDTVKSTVKVSLRIINLNDKGPKFKNLVYNLNVSEDTITGMPLVTLETIDKSDDKNLMFSISGGNSDKLFSVWKNGNNRATISLLNSLDYRSKSKHELQVKVSDEEGYYSVCKVTVNVLPANLETPRFTQDLYKFEVLENATKGTLIGRVQAIDNDFGENGDVTYKLMTNSEGSVRDDDNRNAKPCDKIAFNLNENTGELFVLDQLDHETCDSITLYVTATDNGIPQRSDHGIIQIRVLDVNDNPPIFTKSFYYANVSEDARIGTYVLRVEAKDKDSLENANVKYSLKACCDSSSDMPFSIDPDSGIIRVASKLDRETIAFYNITLIATDSGSPPLSSTAELNIDILDVNDNPPYFDTDTLVFYLKENQPIGTEIANITAKDPDVGENARIVYSLVDGTDNFDLKQSNQYNTVTLISKFVADYEKNETLFTFTLRASSGPLFTDCLVKVYIVDLNDNAPLLANPFKIVFNNYKNFFLMEKYPRIPASDPDVSDNLTYYLMDDIGKQVVSLDENTGIITLKPILNANNQINVTFSVKVNDGVHEVQSTCHLYILMVTDNMLSESVTLNLVHVNVNLFLTTIYDILSESITKIIKRKSNENVHIFNLKYNNDNVNVSFSVSNDYSRDSFVSSSILKQILYSNLQTWEDDLGVSSIRIYEDDACAIEPCLNYQQCQSDIKFISANTYFDYSPYVQFRSININHEFKCVCPIGYAGSVSSSICDVQINICYSNPCGQKGICVPFESTYYCICDADFTGRNCEYDLKNIKCCDSYSNYVKKFISLNATYDSVENTCAAVVPSSDYDFGYSLSNHGRICKGLSECKSRIMGGITCENCMSDSTKSKFYNKFCELRTRHFPEGKNAYLVMPGIKNRLKFKVKLSFATIKDDSYLLYNGRIDRTSDRATDFIGLRINSGKLKLCLSFGSSNLYELNLDEIKVNDGKWRTVTIDYYDNNVTLSVDNDDFSEIDACENSRSSKHIEGYNECFRVTKSLNLKCSTQLENCFKYLDLNGPLQIGNGDLNDLNMNVNNQSYEGCISDLYINEKMVDLNDGSVIDFGTQIGCQPKEDVCKSNEMSQCDKCTTIWNSKVKCTCKTDDFVESSYCKVRLTQSVLSLKGDGYININEQVVKESNLKMSFLIKTTQESTDMSMFVVELYSSYLHTSVLLSTLNLDYVAKNKSLYLYLDKVEIIELNVRFIFDGKWNKISLELNQYGVNLAIDEIANKSSNHNSVVYKAMNYAKWYIGGSNATTTGFIGCIKEIERTELGEKVNVYNGCDIPSRETCTSNDCKPVCGSTSYESPCFNNATCKPLTDSKSKSFECICKNGFKGDYCQHAISSNTLLSDKSTCPAKWWGKESGMCGPCECDESLNFSPDCNKTTGQCSCKPRFYRKFNKITKKDYCAPCDCYLEGSSSLQCEPFTGQCSCINTGITGRRCDQCVLQFAELTKGGNCILLNSNQCPKSFFNGILWPRTASNTQSNSSCPKGSIGRAYRFCGENVGWANYVDLSDCKSTKLIELQLSKWSEMLSQNNSELNSYQAIKLADDLNRVTEEAELGDLLEEDNDNFYPSVDYLYTNDLIIIKNLTKYIIQYELNNAPSFLHIQDKDFLRNIFSIINRIWNKKYESNWYDLRESNITLTDLLISVDHYMKSLLKYNKQSLMQQFELSLTDIQVLMNAISNIKAQQVSPVIKFQLVTSDDIPNRAFKYSYVTVKNNEANLPSGLILNNDVKREITNFKVASDILMMNVQNDFPQLSPTNNSLVNLLVEFTLNEYQPSRSIMKNLYCVYLNEKSQKWSTQGSKILSYEPETNTVKCSFEHFSIYTVMTPIDRVVWTAATVEFSLATFVLLPISILAILVTAVLQLLLRNLGSALTIVYSNLCLNVFLMQIIFISGVNSTGSQVLCKLVSVVLHYFHLSSFLWLFVIALHLYRMLTELRDINKIGSRAPVFYYVIAYVIPSIFTSLALGIKQDLYASWTLNAMSNYCWLNLSNQSTDLIYALLIPISITVIGFLILHILSYKETLRKTFKQTDVKLVRYSIVASLVILPFQCFVLLFLYLMMSSLHKSQFFMYEMVYLSSSVIYSIVIVLTMIVLNKNIKEQLYKIWDSFKSKAAFLDESLNASKSKLCTKSPYTKETFGFSKFGQDNNNNANTVKKNYDDINSKYVLDYRDLKTNSNSVSTTTTSGTLENLNNLDELVSDYDNNKFEYTMGMSTTSNCYTTTFSHNTTNTESTGNESSEVNYCLSYNAIGSQNKIRNCDVVDVSKVLKNRELQQNQLVVNELVVNDVSPTLSQTMYNAALSYHNPSPAKTQISTTATTNSYSPFENQLGTQSMTPALDTWYTKSTFPIPSEVESLKISPKNNELTKKSPTPIFWPNTIAEREMSALDGSELIMSPSKIPPRLSNVIPDILSCSTAKNNGLGSPSSNSSILNTNNSLNYANNKRICTLVPIMTHTGSVTNSENESSSTETRV